jgi:predicted amidohydrolase YtcJ
MQKPCSRHARSWDASRYGIASVQHMSMPVSPARLVNLFKQAPTPIRERVMHYMLTDRGESNRERAARLPQRPTPLITVSGTKWVFDGTPIEHTAAFRDPYADLPGTSGQMNFTQAEMESMLRESLRAGQQMVAHIIGDRTTETFLKAMEATGGEAVWGQRRVRIEHGCGLAPDLIARARHLGVVVVIDPSHFVLGDALNERLGGERLHQLEPVRALLDAGIPVALGSDGLLNPYVNIMLATTNPLRPDQALSREEAVTAYTRMSAFAEFAEREKGSLAPGKLADLAVLSQDVFTVPAADLPKTESVLTLVGGKVIYDSTSR